MKTNFLCLSLFLLALGLMSCDNDTKKDPVDSATENYIMVDGIVPFKDVYSHIYYDFDAIEDGVNYGYGHTLMIYGGATQEEMMQITTSFDKDIVGVSFLLYSNEKNALPAGTYRICYDGKGEPDTEANSVFIAYFDFLPAGTDINDMDEDNETYILGGDLIVTRDGDIYTFSLESKLDNGKNIKLFYKGILNIGDYESDFSAPLFTKRSPFMVK